MARLRQSAEDSSRETVNRLAARDKTIDKSDEDCSDAYSSSKGYLRDIRSYPTLQLGVELALRYLLTSPRQRFLWNVCRS